MSAPVHIDDTGFAPAPFDLRGFAKRLIIALIEAVNHDPSEQKARIMIAYADGHLTAAEAEDWIVLRGLQGA